MDKMNFNYHARKWDVLLASLTLLLLLLTVADCFSQSINMVQVKGKIIFSDLKVRATITSRLNGRTQSDDSGFFVISVSKLPDTLVISAVGYKTEYYALKSGKEEILIEMTGEGMDLGIVEFSTGYQQLKPNETTGSVSVINKNALSERGGSNILERLIGQSSGLIQNVGKSTNNPLNKTGFSVRGLGTINGPLDPLIVLDGFIYEGDINNINPVDIEQVSILKDAAAASIWGARAGNGVIVLVSKKSGFSKPTTINLSASILIKDLPDLFASRQMNSGDYIEVERLMFDKGYYNSRISSTPYAALSPAVELLLSKRRGLINDQQTETALDLLKTKDSRSSYLSEFYTKAITQQYNLGIQGGSQQYAYLLSASFEDILGENYTTSKKLNFNFGQDFRFGEKLKLSTKTYFTDRKQGGGRPSYNSLTVGGRTLPYLAFRDENGNGIPVALTFRPAFTDTLANSRLLDWKYYPTEDYKHNQQKNTSTELVASASLSYQILPFLNATASYQYQNQRQISDTYSDELSYASRNQVNLFSQYNRASNVVSYIVPRGGINRWAETQTQSSTLRAQLNLDKTIGLHHLNAIAGAETREVKSNGLGFTRYGYSEDPLISAPIDEVNFYRTILTGSTQQIGSGGISSATTYRFISTYLNFAYTFKERYSLSASVRNDGSNIFGASTNDKWKPLWSVGSAWELSREEFYKVVWLPKLKLKTTFGYSGNVDLTKTALSVGSLNVNAITGLPFTRITSINNPSLRWEQLSQISVALEFGLEKNRFFGSIAVFRKRGKDLYGPSLYDYTSWGGNNELVRNVADMSGRGIEADLHSINLIKGGFKWNSDGYFNYNDSRTLNYYNNSVQGLYNIIGAGNTITPLVGKPLYALALYKWAGLDKAGNPVGYLKGQPSTDYMAIANEAQTTGENLNYMGSASPVIYGSLINTFHYKAFHLSVNLSYKLGYYALRSSFSSSQLINNGTGHSDYALRWQKAGDEQFTNVPAFIYPSNIDRDAFYELAEVNAIKADHIRLDYVNIGYKLSIGNNKLQIKNFELNAGLQNLGLIWKANKIGLDPEYLNTTPPSRMLLIGAHIGF